MAELYTTVQPSSPTVVREVSPDTFIKHTDSVTDVAIKVLHQTSIPSSTVPLLGVAKTEGVEVSQELGKILREDFTWSPQLDGLTTIQKEELFQSCLSEYQTSVIAFEHAVATLAWHDENAIAFAQEFSRRLLHIAKAYFEIVQSEAHVPESSFEYELNRLLNLTAFFGSVSTYSGSVGMNPLVIQRALKEGNLRELMTLCNAAIFREEGAQGVLLNKIFKDLSGGLIRQINERLQTLPLDQRFQISDMPSHITSEGKYKQSEVVRRHREDDHGRLEEPSQARIRERKGPSVLVPRDLSLRELRAGLEDPTIKESDLDEIRRARESEEKPTQSHHLRWLNAGAYYRIRSGCPFVQRAVALGGLPIVSGPSGTTNGFFRAASLLGMNDQLSKGILALAGWMIPTHDHSLHEIRLVGQEFGVPYRGGLPTDFDRLYDELFTQEIKDNLEKQHLHMPSYYLSAEHQVEKARDLGLVSSVQSSEKIGSHIPIS